MDLIALAIPFFILALLLEIAVDRWRGTGHYRLNDAVNSISAGTLSNTLGYFTNFLQVLIFGYFLQNFAIFDIDLAWFDSSPTGLALWLSALLAWDFCYYWAHRFGHEMSVLWAAHAVHHQSEDYNLSTALRQTSTGFLFTWIFYLPLFVIGLPLEVVATVNAVDLIYQFWVHTQHVGKLRGLDRILVTPSNHRVHHAQNKIYIDRNYGGILILWDRLFGSFQEELDDEPVVFGVRKPLRNWNPIWANLQVYSYLWFDARRTRRWRDKIGIWFRRTGWRPADVAAEYPKANADLKEFEKFNPPMTLPLKRYVFLQFTVVILGILWIGVLFAKQGASAVILPCGLLWLTLYALGLLSEGRAYALGFETLRLLVIVPLCIGAMSAKDLIGLANPVLLGLSAGYILASLAGLRIVAKRAESIVSEVL
jgi:alkylglycerol monooxygenase